MYQTRRRGREVTLTYEEFLSLIAEDTCHYCGTALQWAEHLGANSRAYRLDRTDNTKGYTFDNCVTCCPTCNKAKSDMPYAEFIAWVSRLYHNLKRKNIVTDS